MSEQFYSTVEEQNLQYRITTVVEKLGHVAGAHLPTATSAKPTPRDERRLTYLEITQQPVNQKDAMVDDSNLFKGATACYDPVVVCTLMEAHLQHIDAYLQRGSTHSHPTQLAGHDVHELIRLQEVPVRAPVASRTLTVDGTDYYRGYVADTGAGTTVIVLRPWMQPSQVGGSPFPQIYTRGNPDIETVREVARSYAETTMPSTELPRR